MIIHVKSKDKMKSSECEGELPTSSCQRKANQQVYKARGVKSTGLCAHPVSGCHCSHIPFCLGEVPALMVSKRCPPPPPQDCHTCGYPCAILPWSLMQPSLITSRRTGSLSPSRPVFLGMFVVVFLC